MARIIQITPYNPEWPRLYRQEARQIVSVLSNQILLIHHIGSTAIPGIKAKPIIDFLIEVRQIEAIDAVNDVMVAMNYDPRGENGLPGRRYFVKKTNETHTHHLHVYEVNHPDIERHLVFRDYLRANPDKAQAYSQLKERLAQEYRHDSVAYTEGKSEFIHEVERFAFAWRAS